jgi:hypothetical protein
MMRLLRSLKTPARNDWFNPGSRSNLPGQSLVEFALLLPVFVLAIVVIFDLGRAVYYYSAIYNAAREGVRYGAVQPNDLIGIRNTTINYAFGLGLDVANVRMGRGIPQSVDNFNNPTVKVIVEFCFIPVTPLVERFLPNRAECGGRQELFLTSEAVMRTEVIPSPTLPLP